MEDLLERLVVAEYDLTCKKCSPPIGHPAKTVPARTALRVWPGIGRTPHNK
jgi:hypothetical protein